MRPRRTESTYSAQVPSSRDRRRRRGSGSPRNSIHSPAEASSGLFLQIDMQFFAFFHKNPDFFRVVEPIGDLLLCATILGIARADTVQIFRSIFEPARGCGGARP